MDCAGSFQGRRSLVLGAVPGIRLRCSASASLFEHNAAGHRPGLSEGGIASQPCSPDRGQFPRQVAPRDLDFGPGTIVRGIVSSTSADIVAEVDVAADAPLGKHGVAFRRSVLPGAIAVYDRIDYVKVTPESAVAAFSDST